MIKQQMDEYIQETENKFAEIEAQLEQLKHEKLQAQTEVKEIDGPRVRTVRDREKTNIRAVPLEKYKSTFEATNFKLTNVSKKAAEFEHPEYGAYIYLLDNVTPTIAIHPSLFERANTLVEIPNKLVKSTALRRFPKKEEDGKLKSNFGYTYTFQTKSELESLLARIVQVLEDRHRVRI
ncbi:DUF2002 family protein [Bacillus sp. DNRA2]|uniref:DUF2002 family protein n=1 Tax=Bacillus sp. DNRA2 TaxID=2723053 RepID=UPI00145C501A|nr:DUF2002 family protein [Bacillus sp. DNRA2]NMD72300.1 DUF2002 family protein [Bacillus sp. DNRA2]